MSKIKIQNYVTVGELQATLEKLIKNGYEDTPVLIKFFDNFTPLSAIYTPKSDDKYVLLLDEAQAFLVENIDAVKSNSTNDIIKLNA